MEQQAPYFRYSLKKLKAGVSFFLSFSFSLWLLYISTNEWPCLYGLQQCVYNTSSLLCDYITKYSLQDTTKHRTLLFLPVGPFLSLPCFSFTFHFSFFLFIRPLKWRRKTERKSKCIKVAIVNLFRQFLTLVL